MYTSGSLYIPVSTLVRGRPPPQTYSFDGHCPRTHHIRRAGMCRIKEQLGEYVQGKIQEIAEHAQCTKVGLPPSVMALAERSRFGML